MLNHTANLKAISEICHIAGTMPNTSLCDFKMQLAVLAEEGREILLSILDDNYHGDDGLVDALPDTLFVLYTLMLERGLTPCDNLELRGHSGSPKERDIFTLELARDIHRGIKKISRDGEFYLAKHTCTKLLKDLLSLAGHIEHDLQACLDVVIEANLRKFDTNSEDAQLTKEKYASLGIATYVRATHHEGKTYYVVCVDGDQVKVDKTWPNHKWLKSHRWEAPVYHEDCFVVDI